MNHKFLTLAMDGVYATSLFAMRDVLQIANHIMADQKLPRSVRDPLPSLESYLISLDGEPVTTACGLRLPVDGSLQDVPQTATIYLPAIYMAADAEAWLRTHKKMIAPLLPWIKRRSQKGEIVGAVATSSLLLAEAGLLQKMRVPVPWMLEEFLHRRYPSIIPERHKEVVQARNIYCAGNISSSLALAIELFDSRAPLMTGLVNQYIRPTELTLQTSSTFPTTEISDPLIVHAMALIQTKFTKTIDYAKLAHDLAVSQRTLIRHFNRELGQTPQSYQQQLRLEASKRLLAETQLPIARVAESMGYTTPAYFCRLFRQRLGISVQAYQEQSRVARAKADGTREDDRPVH